MVLFTTIRKEERMIRSSYMTKCGKEVLVPEGTIKHLQAHPEVGALIEAGLLMLSIPDHLTELKTEIDFGKVIGTCACVPVKENEPETFAYRTGRKNPTRVVLNAETTPCTTLVVVLVFREHETTADYYCWYLITAYVGKVTPRKPWDRYFTTCGTPQEFQEAFQFWSENGLVYDPAVMGPWFTGSWKQILHL